MRIIVVGGGITGVSAALGLQRAGVGVTLIDRARPGDPAQASFGNGGILARSAVAPNSMPGLWSRIPALLLSPEAPLFLRWRHLPRFLPWGLSFLRAGMTTARARRIAEALSALTSDSVADHRALAAGTAAERFIAEGDYVHIYRRPEDHAGAEVALKAALGFSATPLDEATLRARDPALGPDYRFGAAYAGHGWITDPGAYVAALFEAFRALGGTFLDASVARVEEGRVLLSDGRELAGDRIVVAAGAWSAGLVRALGHRVPLETERGYHVMLHGANHMPPGPYMVSDAQFVITPMAGGLRAAGIVEFGGLDAPPSKAPFALIRRRLKQVYPGLRWERATEWMGHRPSLPDSLPMVGPAPRAPGVVFAFGSQHLGLTIGPRLGRIVTDLVLGRKPNVDLRPFAVDRFD